MSFKCEALIVIAMALAGVKIVSQKQRDQLISSLIEIWFADELYGVDAVSFERPCREISILQRDHHTVRTARFHSQLDRVPSTSQLNLPPNVPAQPASNNLVAVANARPVADFQQHPQFFGGQRSCRPRRRRTFDVIDVILRFLPTKAKCSVS